MLNKILPMLFFCRSKCWK